MTDHATCILQHISWESSHENGDFWFIIDIWFFQFIAKQVNCTLLKNACTYKMAHYLVWLIMEKKKEEKTKNQMNQQFWSQYTVLHSNTIARMYPLGSGFNY